MKIVIALKQASGRRNVHFAILENVKKDKSLVLKVLLHSSIKYLIP